MSQQALNPIEHAKSFYESGAQRFLKTFSFTPDDKLTWSPSPTAKTSLRLAAHVAVTNYFFAQIFSGKSNEFKSAEEAMGFIDKEEKKITSRSEALKAIDDSGKVLLAALSTLTPDKLSTDAQTPFGSVPMSHMITIPGLHMHSHGAQLDYLQTIWGDLDPHMS